MTTFWALHLVAALLLEEPDGGQCVLVNIKETVLEMMKPVLALGTLPYHGFRRHVLQLRPRPNLR